MTISFEGIKTVVITPPLASGKQRKSTKSDKGYIEGQPLPDKGACKHYRKSLRWFRLLIFIYQLKLNTHNSFI